MNVIVDNSGNLCDSQVRNQCFIFTATIFVLSAFVAFSITYFK